MSAVLEVIADAFIWIAKRVADIIAFAFLLASLPGIWRLPWLFKELDMSKEEWRVVAIGNFFLMVGDIITVAVFFACIPTWRVIFLLVNSLSECGKFYKGTFHAMVWYTFGNLLLDIPMFIIFIIAHLPFWRIHKLYAKLAAETYFPLISCDKTIEHATSKHREIVLVHLTETKMLQTIGNALIDFFCGIMGFFVFVTILHAKAYYKASVEAFEYTHQFTTHQIQAWTTEEHDYEVRYKRRVAWRKQSLLYFGKALFDLIITLPLFCVVIASLYRGFLILGQLYVKMSSWAPVDKPKIEVEKMRFEAPPNGRTKGIVWKIEGVVKDPEFSISKDTKVNLFVRSGDDFWDSVGRLFGGSASTFGQMLLPLRLDKDYFDTSILASPKKMDSKIELVFDFETKFGLKTILENTDRFSMSQNVEVQVEVGDSHEHTLFVCSFTLKQIRLSVEEGFSFDGKESNVNFAKVATPENIQGASFSDIFWRLTLLQFILLMRDLFTIVGFILVHFFPHRAYNVYNSMCEGPARAAAKKQAEKIKQLLAGFKFFTPIPITLDQHVSEVDTYIRAVINKTSRRPRGSTNRYFNSYFNSDDDYNFSDDDDDDHQVGYHSKLRRNIHGDKRSNSWSYYYWDYDSRSRSVSQPEWSLDKFMSKLTAAISEFNEKSSTSPAAASASEALKKLEKKIAAACEGVRRCYNMKHTGGLTVPQFYTPGAVWPKFRKELNNSNQHGYNRVGGRKKKNNGDDEEIEVLPALSYNELAKKPLQNNILGEEVDLYKLDFDPDFTPMEQYIHSEAEKIQQQLEIDLEEALKLANSEIDEQKCCESSKADGWDGVVSTVASEIANLFLDIGSVICFFIVACTIYRLPWICREVYGSYKKRMTCVMALRELALDVGYLLMFIFVVATVRDAIKILTDFMSYLPRYPSFQVARAIISYHFTNVTNLLWIFASLFFSCRAIKFSLATSVFAALSPGVMMESALLRLDAREGEGAGKCVAATLLCIACFWMFGVPFLAANQGEAEYTATPAAIYFGVLAFFVFLAIVSSFIHADTQIFLLRRPVVRFARPTMANVLAFFYLLFEAAQLLALSFSAAYAGGYLQNSQLLEFSQGIFFLFGQEWTSDNVAFGAYLSIGIMVIHFMIVAMPIVTGYLLDWDDGAEINKHPIWIGALTLLGFLLQMTVSRNVAELTSCSNGTSTYNQLNGFKPELVYTFNASGNNETTVSGPVCWEGPHRALAITSMILGVFYLPTTLSRNAFFDESFFTSIDVVYTQFYRMLTGAFTVTAVVTVALLTPHADKSKDALVVILVMSLLSFLISVFYRYIANRAELATHNEEDFVTLPALRNCRIAVYLGSMISAAICLGQVNNSDADRSSLVPAYASAGVMIGLYLIALIYSVVTQICHRYPEDESFDALRDDLLNFEEELVRKEKMNLVWSHNFDKTNNNNCCSTVAVDSGMNCITGSGPRDAWRSAVKSAMRISALALQVVKLEENMSLLKVSPMFLRNKPRWNADLKRLVDDVDLEDDIEAVIRQLSYRSNRYCFGDCEADCDFCCGDGDFSGRRRWHRGSNLEKWLNQAHKNTFAKQVRRLERAVQSLMNAARSQESELVFELPQGSKLANPANVVDDDDENDNQNQADDDNTDVNDDHAPDYHNNNVVGDDMALAIAASLETQKDEDKKRNNKKNKKKNNNTNPLAGSSEDNTNKNKKEKHNKNNRDQLPGAIASDLSTATTNSNSNNNRSDQQKQQQSELNLVLADRTFSAPAAAVVASSSNTNNNDAQPVASNSESDPSLSVHESL